MKEDLRGKSGIYAIKNIVNNKMYIGRSKDVYYRMSGHLEALINNEHNNKHLQNSFNKYGRSNFKYKILAFAEVDELYELEEQFIKQYKTYFPAYGYNKTYGGKSEAPTKEIKIKSILTHRKRIGNDDEYVSIFDYSIQYEPYYDVIKTNPNIYWEKIQFQIKSMVKRYYNEDEDDYNELYNELYIKYIELCKEYNPYINGEFMPFKKYVTCKLSFYSVSRIQYKERDQKRNEIKYESYMQDKTHIDDYEFDEAFKILSEIPNNYDKMVKMYFLYNIKQQDLAKMFNISQPRISMIIGGIKKHSEDTFYGKIGSKLYELYK